MRVFSRGKDKSDWPSGRSLCRCTYIVFFQNPPYMASRQLLIPRIATAGTSLSPLPCRARVTKSLFLRGQPNRKLRDRYIGPFNVEKQIEKHRYIFKLLATLRLHPVFHVTNLRPFSIVSLRHVVQVISTPKDNDNEIDVSHIFAVCIKSLQGRRGKYFALHDALHR
jgi:hypothetical protein